ncbi:MAG: hypothetical protein ACE5GO_01795 [Anaerolineales bacterium]
MFNKKQLLKLTLIALLTLLLPLTLTACKSSLEKNIAGAWKHAPSGETWEFFKDGTLSVSGGLMPMAGSYEVVDDNHVRLDFGGLGALAGPIVATASISGNRLTLDAPDRGVLEFTRVR